MTVERIAEVNTWFERIIEHTTRAIALSDRMTYADMKHSCDYFWALAKYVENVEESVVKLDDLNPRIYPTLLELGEQTWKGLKGMRSRLAHAFWNIDPQILWSTVKEDFPKLRDLLSTLMVVEHPCRKQRSRPNRL